MMDFCQTHGPDSLCSCDEYVARSTTWLPPIVTESWRDDMAKLDISFFEVKKLSGMKLTENETEMYFEAQRERRREADEKRDQKKMEEPMDSKANNEFMFNNNNKAARTAMDAHAEQNLARQPAPLVIDGTDGAEVARLRYIAEKYQNEMFKATEEKNKLAKEVSDLRIRNQTLKEQADALIRRDRPRKMKMTMLPNKTLLAKGVQQRAWELLTPDGPPKYLMLVQVPEEMPPSDAIEIMRKQKLIFDDTLGKNRVAMAVCFPGHEIMLAELNYDGFEDEKKNLSAKK